MKNKVLKMASKIILEIAKSAAGAASEWNTYQPKEPEILKKISK